MPESIEEFHARVLAAQEAAGGRLPLDPEGFTAWEAFPFDGELTAKAVAQLQDIEARFGEDPADCWCAASPPADDQWPTVWRDQHWRLKLAPPSGSPLVLMLQPNAHHDLNELPRERAAELGILTVLLTGAMEALPSVGRAHMARWGDGGAHAHIWFLARPARMPQMRGTFNALWDDILPPVPAEVARDNAAAVVAALIATYGGQRGEG